MKKQILIGIISMSILLFAGCKTAAPSSADTESSSSQIISSKEISSEAISSQEVSSELASSEPASSKETSSKPTSSKEVSSKEASSKPASSKEGKIDPNTPVSPPLDNRTQAEIDKEIAQLEKKGEEQERLLSLPAEFTATLDKEVYSIGEKEILLTVYNEGEGAVGYDNAKIVDRLNGDKWESIGPSQPPSNYLDGIAMPKETQVIKYHIGNKLTEAGKYRIKQLFIVENVGTYYTYEFTLE